MLAIDIKETGNNIRLLMEEREVNYKDICSYLGVSYQAVYKWLNGINLPTLDNVIGLAFYLDVPVEDLVAVYEY